MKMDEALKVLGIKMDTDGEPGECTGPDSIHCDSPDEAVYFSLGFCGCGLPDEVRELVRDVLAAHATYHDAADKTGLFPMDRIQELAECGEVAAYFIAYTLDAAGMTEHGGSIGGAWLTEKGKAALTVLGGGR